MFDWVVKILNRIKELNKSVDVYKKETNNQAMPSLAYVNRAKNLIESKEYLLAKEVLQQSLLISDKDAITYKYLGICEERLGNIEDAISAYKKSAMFNPLDKNIWYKLGMAQTMLKRYEDAEKSFEEAHKVTPVNTDVQTGWGMALLKQKKYKEAHEKFINAIKINRYNFSALLLCAIVEVRLKLYDDAYKKMSFLIKTNPTEACMYEFANLNFIKNNYDEAIRYSKYAIEYNKKMLPAYLLIGKIYAIRQDFDKSKEIYLLAESNDLHSEVLYVDFGNSMLRMFKYFEAKSAFVKALSENENSIDAKIGISYCDNATGEFIQDIELSENIYSYMSKAFFLFNNQKYEDALAIFKQVLEKEPNELLTYYILAKCYEKMNNSMMIEDSYDKLNKFAPKFIFGYIDYAKYLISKNDYKDAQRKLRKAENLDPENQEVLNLLFYVGYLLVKDDDCEYNIKEVITLADRINDFKYSDLKIDLEKKLENIKK